MNKNSYLARCAPLAIVAMAALPATPVLAQDAAAPTPVIVLPEPVMTTTAPPPAPIVIDVPTPTSEAVTVAEEPAATTTTRSTATDAAPARATRNIPRRASTVSTTVSSSASVPAGEAQPAPTPIEPVIMETAPVAAQPAIAEPAVGPIQDNSSEALLLGLLGALGIGGVAFALLRSRRRRTAEPELIERPVVRREPLPVVPVMTREARTQRNEPVHNAPNAALAPTSAVIALPSELPPSFEERDRLLREMIAAKPDKANPFRSRGARAKRARLILQSLGRDFGTRKPRIDLSQYTEVWPSLRGWRPATA